MAQPATRDSRGSDAALFFLNAFLHGYFPMGTADPENPVRWVSPLRRSILPLDNFRFPRRLRRTARRHRFHASVNQDFAAVIAHCANRDRTWINREIHDLYMMLHDIGLAHSIEVRIEDRLVGGLYGFALGGAFSGESMFSLFPSSSQIALLHLVVRLRESGFNLLDVQFQTAHLERFGAVQVSRDRYLKMLGRAVRKETGFPDQPSGEATSAVLQRMSQTSYRE